MKRFLQEPLLHFLLVGAAIFAVYSWMPQRDGGAPESIVVTQGQIASLVATFARTWQRPPSSVELEGLIRDRVREEVYFREAMALGLDKDDTIIRRRLRQKLEFVSDDIAAQTEPTDDELRAYLHAHPDAFRVQGRLTFRQLYLSAERRGENLARDAAQLLARLSHSTETADVSALGDAFLLEHDFVGAPYSEVAKLFGEPFAAKLAGLPLGRWQGPVESGYGAHLVFVSERTEARLPELAEVRDAVRREWQNARRLEANENFYRALLERYTVTIEGPQPTPEQKKLAEAE